MKPVVKYKHDLNNFIQVGMNAYVFPLNHHSKYVSNQFLVKTSKVISFDKKLVILKQLIQFMNLKKENK